MRRRPAAFTLVEMLVATVILLLIMAIILTMTQQTGNVWRSTVGKTEVFRSARTAFDALTRTLSQATLNTYYDYATVNGTSLSFIPLGSTTPPTTYGRNSDLQIVSGLTSTGTTLLPGISPYTAVTHAVFFQAPLGYNNTYNNSSSTGYTSLDGLVNTCGFYVAYGPDPSRPGFLPNPALGGTSTAMRYRYRLMQFLQSSNNLGIYAAGTGPKLTAQGTASWYLAPVQNDTAAPPASDFVLAENVVALIILPRMATKDEAAAEAAYGVGVTGPLGTALAPGYAYDSSTSGPGGNYNSSTGTSQYPLLDTLNQLPPVMQVTMVAIDEVSALKISAQNAGSPTTPPNAALGLTPTMFTQSQNLQADLASFEAALAAAHVNFRVFQTDVAIRGSKWTNHN